MSKLPNAEQAIVPLSKIVDYLLAAAHPEGQSKAFFFTSFGFRPEEPETLRGALLKHGQDNDAVALRGSPHGAKYPCGRTLARS